MNNHEERLIWHPSGDRTERLKELRLSRAEFAALSGANDGFSPLHQREWTIFWKTDICEKDEYHTWFPALTLAEARRVWMAIEEHFLGQYTEFLRVWPEWHSSGIWSAPYPGSRVAGGMVDYDQLSLPQELVGRFEAWQAEFDEGGPFEPISDPEAFTKTGEGLARDLKRCVGPDVYVEFHELIEVLMDGTTRSCHPVLGLPDANA